VTNQRVCKYFTPGTLAEKTQPTAYAVGYLPPPLRGCAVDVGNDKGEAPGYDVERLSAKFRSQEWRNLKTNASA
jgi:hypothetical protein